MPPPYCLPFSVLTKALAQAAPERLRERLSTMTPILEEIHEGLALDGDLSPIRISTTDGFPTVTDSLFSGAYAHGGYTDLIDAQSNALHLIKGWLQEQLREGLALPDRPTIEQVEETLTRAANAYGPIGLARMHRGVVNEQHLGIGIDGFIAVLPEYSEKNYPVFLEERKEPGLMGPKWPIHKFFWDHYGSRVDPSTTFKIQLYAMMWVNGGRYRKEAIVSVQYLVPSNLVGKARLVGREEKGNFIQELEQRGWKVSGGDRYEYVTDKEDTLRVQIKERSARLQGRDYVSGAWGDMRALGNIKDLSKELAEKLTKEARQTFPFAADLSKPARAILNNLRRYKGVQGTGDNDRVQWFTIGKVGERENIKDILAAVNEDRKYGLNATLGDTREENGEIQMEVRYTVPRVKTPFPPLSYSQALQPISEGGIAIPSAAGTLTVRYVQGEPIKVLGETKPFAKVLGRDGLGLWWAGKKAYWYVKERNMPLSKAHEIATALRAAGATVTVEEA